MNKYFIKLAIIVSSVMFFVHMTAMEQNQSSQLAKIKQDARKVHRSRSESELEKLGEMAQNFEHKPNFITWLFKKKDKNKKVTKTSSDEKTVQSIVHKDVLTSPSKEDILQKINLAKEKIEKVKEVIEQDILYKKLLGAVNYGDSKEFFQLLPQFTNIFDIQDLNGNTPAHILLGKLAEFEKQRQPYLQMCKKVLTYLKKEDLNTHLKSKDSNSIADITHLASDCYTKCPTSLMLKSLKSGITLAERKTKRSFSTNDMHSLITTSEKTKNVRYNEANTNTAKKISGKKVKALFNSITEGNVESFSENLEEIGLNVQDAQGNTPLHILIPKFAEFEIAREPYAKMYQAILEKVTQDTSRTNVNKLNNEKQTIVDIAYLYADQCPESEFLQYAFQSLCKLGGRSGTEL